MIQGAYSLEKDGVTQSMLRDFLGCRKRLLYKLMGYRSLTPRSTPRFGSMTHYALSKMYEAMRAGETNKTKLGKIVTKELEKYVNREAKSASSALLIQEIEGQSVLVAMILEEYLGFWYERDCKKKWTSLERVFDVDFRGFRLRGRWDGGYELDTRSGEEVWLLETKTKSKVSEDSLELSLALDFQSQFYLTAAGLILPKPERLKGVLYNIIRNPNLYRRVNENDQDYAERVREDIQKRPAHYFKRFELTYSDKQLRLFQQELEYKLQEYEMWLDMKLKTYGNENSCDVFWKCEFLNMCASGGSEVGYDTKRVLFEELVDIEEVSDGSKKGNSKKDFGFKKVSKKAGRKKDSSKAKRKK